MFELTDDERAYLTEMSALTTDSNGKEVLFGLTREETEFYIERSRDFIRGVRNRDTRDRYLELHDRHEAIRLSVLMAENQLRVDKPTKN